MALRLVSSAVLCAAANSVSPCDVAIPGYWREVSNAGSIYHAVWTAPQAFTVSAVIPTSWTTSAGVLSANNATVTATFSNGHKGTGVVAPNCSQIVWDDKTAWETIDAPNPINVAFIMHSHGVSVVVC